MSRPTAWRLIKRVMTRANIQDRQATGKGLRHGFGVAMITASRPLPIHVLSQLMGHASTKVTEIYLQMVGEEQRQLVMEAWEYQTGSSPVSCVLWDFEPARGRQGGAGRRGRP